MTKWTIKKLHHWHVCRDGKRFATVNEKEDADAIIRIGKEMETVK